MNALVLTFRLFVVLFFLATSPQGLAIQTNDIESTERPLLEPLSVTYCIDCVPFQYQAENNRAAGLIIDLWKLWSGKTGIEVHFEASSWNQTIENVKSGKSQVHAGLFFCKSRSRYLSFGATLASTDTHVFLHRDLPSISNVADLSGYRTGVLTGDFVEGYLKKRLPVESIITFNNYSEIFDALETGVIRAFAADTFTGIYYLNEKNLLTDYKISESSLLYDNDWNIAVKKGRDDLLELIDDGMGRITEKERAGIISQWASIVSADDEATVLAVQGLNDTPDSAYIKGLDLLKNLAYICLALLFIVVAYWLYLGRPKQLTIRQILFVTFLIFAVSVTAISGLISQLWGGEQRELEIKNLEYKSIDLALEFKQSSDDLTRMSRLYTIDGNAAFEQYFKMIVAIRDGKQPRPKNYTRTYWDHILAGSVNLNTSGPKYSLEQKMLDLKFSEKERFHIATAKKKSDELVVIETVAMNAVMGIF